MPPETFISGSIDTQARFESMRRHVAQQKYVFQRHRDLSIACEKRVQILEKETRIIASRIARITSEFEERKRALAEAEERSLRHRLLPPIVKSRPKGPSVRDGQGARRGGHRNTSQHSEKLELPSPPGVGVAQQGEDREALSEVRAKTPPEAGSSSPVKVEVVSTSDLRKGRPVVSGTMATPESGGELTTSHSGVQGRVLDKPSEATERDEQGVKTFLTTDCWPSSDSNLHLRHTDNKHDDIQGQSAHTVTVKTRNTTEVSKLGFTQKSENTVTFEEPNDASSEAKTQLSGESKEPKTTKTEGQKAKLKDGSQAANSIGSDPSGSMRQAIPQRKKKRVLLFRVEKTGRDLNYINELKKPSELERKFFSKYVR